MWERREAERINAVNLVPVLALRPAASSPDSRLFSYWDSWDLVTVLLTEEPLPRLTSAPEQLPRAPSLSHPIQTLTLSARYLFSKSSAAPFPSGELPHHLLLCSCSPNTYKTVLETSCFWPFSPVTAPSKTVSFLLAETGFVTLISF